MKPLIRPEKQMSQIEKLAWGIFWGVFIGGLWLLGDFIRPLIYGSAV